MSDYSVNINGKTNTLDEIFRTQGGTPANVTDYKNQSKGVTFATIENNAIESTNTANRSLQTGYSSQGTEIADIGYSAYFFNRAAGASATFDISNYSSCSIIMCGGGGGGGGGGDGAYFQIYTPGGDGGNGGDGGIIIIRDYDISAFNSVQIQSANNGGGGQGAPSVGQANNGTSGNDTIVTFSPTISFNAQGGGRGNAGNSSTPNGSGTPGNNGAQGSWSTNAPAQSYSTYSPPGNVIQTGQFVDMPEYTPQFHIIVTSNSTTYCQGGGGGQGANQFSVSAQDGDPGYDGYARIYLYT